VICEAEYAPYPSRVNRRRSRVAWTWYCRECVTYEPPRWMVKYERDHLAACGGRRDVTFRICWADEAELVREDEPEDEDDPEDTFTCVACGGETEQDVVDAAFMYDADRWAELTDAERLQRAPMTCCYCDEVMRTLARRATAIKLPPPRLVGWLGFDQWNGGAAR
jgi:hypothetical protein